MVEHGGVLAYVLLPILAAVLALAWVAWVLRRRDVAQLSLRGLGIELVITTVTKPQDGQRSSKE